MIEIASERPKDVSPNALASAQPFEGSAIAIYYQTLKWAEHDTRLAPRLFAHVLAHEIGHNLQQIAVHSKTGVMKASWTGEDYSLMGNTSLRFEAGDIESIHAGLAARTARIATLSAKR